MSAYGWKLPGDPGVRSKADQLRRMQRLSTCLLGGMLVLLLVSASYQARYPWLEWIRAFAEAGAVGALADWYAVTALFRKPLGLPIPHTAIIPNNKDGIGESLGDFVEQNFLTPENIIAKLRQHNAAQALAEWLAAPGNSLEVAQAFADFVPDMLEGLNDKDVRQFFDRALTPQLMRINVSWLAGNTLAVLTENNRHQGLLDHALHALERWLVAKKNLIRVKFSKASRYTPGLLDDYIVNKFVQGIIALLHEVVDNPKHELRGQFDQTIRTLIRDLTNSSEYEEKGKVLMRQLVEHIQREDYYRLVWDDVKSRVKADLESEPSMIRGHIADVLVALGERLLDEPGVQEKLNVWWLETVFQVVLRYRHQISSLITEVVKSWDAEEVSRKVELEIGRDLQYIRINGTFVGGLVGLLLHAGIHVMDVIKAAC